jgi:anaerobic selenocysteine-containing dehydrogenase
MRLLDRLAGPDPPKLVVVDPRPTPVAREATIHLPIKSGTNVALLNAFLHEILENGHYDEEYVEAHTMGPFVERYGEAAPAEPDRLYHELFDETRSGGLGLLRDMQDLYPMANACDISWTMIGQAAQGLPDRDLLEVVDSCEGQTAMQIKWLKTRMKQAAPQALLVAS